MIRIGIELNGIVRDINTQILKYYVKDIDKGFDDTKVDKNVLNVANSLDFGSKKKREEFIYVDYPYEIFGCAKTCERNLAVNINNWIYEFSNIENEDYELVFFSTNEDALTIQSTYYFLSKIGCRVREMHFPKDGADMWKICDVIITTNERIVKKKPEGKVSILINKNDNEDLKKRCLVNYDTLNGIIEDETFLPYIKQVIDNYKPSLISRIKNFFK